MNRIDRLTSILIHLQSKRLTTAHENPTTSTKVKDRVKTDFANCDSVIGYGTFMNQMQYAYTDAQRLEQLNYKLYLINSDGFSTNEIGLSNHCKSSFQVQTIAATGH